MNETMIQIVREIQIPSEWQTWRFAEFVIQAHSWYKKLPMLPPGVRVFFYLSPTAGMDWEPSQRRYLEVSEFNKVRPDAYTTADRREYFGFWMYSMLQATATTCDIPADTIGSRTALPESLAAACSCEVTAFLHPHARQVNRQMAFRAQVARSLERYHAQHPDFERYRELLRNVGEGTGSRHALAATRSEEQRITDLVYWFATAEHRRLADRVRDTLMQAREAWAALKNQGTD